MGSTRPPLVSLWTPESGGLTPGGARGYGVAHFVSAAWAATSRAIGTRNGEQLT